MAAASFPAAIAPTSGATFTTSTVSQTERDKSIGDPRGIVWSSSGRGYVTGMGSNNLIIIDAAGTRLAPLGDPGAVTVELGEGPTGLALDDVANRLYFEELSLERLLDIYELESPLGVIVSMKNTPS